MRQHIDNKVLLLVKVSAVAVAAIAMAQMTLAQQSTIGSKPVIAIVDPMASDPLLTGDHSSDGPLTQHHVVFSRSTYGTRSMEIGYNEYRAGFRVDTAYAFKDSDGLCYVPSGSMEITSDGVVVKVAPRSAMWRPAGAMTEHVNAIRDTVTICAVSPARDEHHKVELGQAEVGRWAGDVALQPHVHFFAVEFVRPEVRREAGLTKDLIVERRVVSLHKDGSAKLDLTQFQFTAGAVLRDGRGNGEQMCWLESGRLELSSGGKISSLNAGNFLLRPEGAVIGSVRALENSSLLCYSAPARL